MSTAAPPAPPKMPSGAGPIRAPRPGDAPPVEQWTPRWKPFVAVLALWVLVWFFTKGRDTLELAGLDYTTFHGELNGIRDNLQLHRATNPVMRVTTGVADVIKNIFPWLQQLISVPALPRPVPVLGWLGVTAVAAWVAGLLANWRMALLTTVSFLSFGFFGYWSDSMDLLLVIGISVGLSVLIGLPLAVLVGTTKRPAALIEGFLDLLQTMPTFVYLLPLVLFFGIGVSTAIAATLLYAVPPLVRIGGSGIRNVNPAMIEVTDSLGQTWWQRLTKVQLPLARKTLIVGLNQTTMAALSMAVISSYVNGPGLGKPVFNALILSDVGAAFIPGVLIVVMAIMLDRVTTAASERAELSARKGSGQRVRVLGLGLGALGALAALVLSRQLFWAASWDKLWAQVAPSVNLKRSIADTVNTVVRSFTDTVEPASTALKEVITRGLLNPLQSLLADSPWWLAFAALAVIAFVLGGLRALVYTLICAAGIRYFDLWNDAMITLAMTLVATVLVMALGVLVGVPMARSRKVDIGVRPILDAGQTIPAFVYLIPVLALFGSTRFSAIVAGIVYAAPAAIKLIADGVSSVSATTMEAVRSQGATTMQQVFQAQLPMAKPSLVLAANQGLLYVLAMAVIGGMVGAGALGYDVVLGSSSVPHWGKGLAAGITITLLGIMLDKIARSASSEDWDPVGWFRGLTHRQPRP